MRKSTKFIALSLSAILLFTISAGCSNTDNTESTDSLRSSLNDEIDNLISSLENQSSPSFERSIDSNIEFDADKVFKSIKINDIVLPSPCSLSDFGSEYTFGMNMFDGKESESGRLIGNIIHDEKKAISVDIYNIKTSDYNDKLKLSKAKFDVISQEKDNSMNSHTILSVDGISIGDKINDVEAAFGIPMIRSMNSSNTGSYTYAGKDDTKRKIQFDFSENCISKITIYYNILEG